MHNSSLPQGDDEIDIRELSVRVWRVRYSVITTSILVVVFVFGLFLTNYLRQQHYTLYSSTITLTFDGLEAGQYPNGTPFSLSELISQSVLSEVYQQFNFGEYGLNLEDFISAISIEPYAPEYDFIVDRYRVQLTSKNLSAAERTSIEQQMRNELKNATKRQARLTLLLPVGTVDDITADALLSAIPRVWATNAIEDKGVLQLNEALVTPRVFDVKRFENLDFLIAVDLLEKNIDRLKGNIASLKAYPNYQTLVDKTSGYSILDLEKFIDDTLEFDVRQVVDPVKQLGLARDPELTILYYQREIEEKRLKVDLFLERARVVEEALTRFQRDNTMSSVTGKGGDNATVPQVSDAFIDRLLEISEQGSAQAYRQDLSAKALEYRESAAKIQGEINETQSFIDKLSLAKAGDETADKYLDRIHLELPLILKTLTKYTQITLNFYAQLNETVYGTESRLYVGSGEGMIANEESMLTGTQMKILGGLFVLSILFLTPMFVIMQAFKEPQRESPVAISAN